MTDRDDSLLAAEHVVGLLAPETSAEVERRAVSDAAFARRIDYWRARLFEFDATAEETIPDSRLWETIESKVTTSAAIASKQPSRTSIGFWNSLPALRVVAVGSFLIAAICAGLAMNALRYAQDVATRKPLFVAILVDEATKQTGAVVNAFADGRAELIPLTDINVPAGRVLEIWTLWDRAVGPRSVGTIAQARATRLNLETLPTTREEQLFEITLEPAGGSPLGRPTGPILYKGLTARAL